MCAAIATHDLVASLRTVRETIARTAQRVGCTQQPRLVAVSKTKPTSVIRQAYDVGQRHFGENYVQELCTKACSLPADIHWHFIGHLQSNKCKQVAKIPNLYMVESVDSTKLATSLHKACIAVGRQQPLRVLIQVNTSGEASKFGCAPSETTSLVRHVISECHALQVDGLMTIGDLDAKEPQPDCFKRLAACRDTVIRDIPSLASTLTELSMGMSADYALAIEHGATSVRVGSTIFGARDYSKEVADEQAAYDKATGNSSPNEAASSSTSSSSSTSTSTTSTSTTTSSSFNFT